jgi:hypothetical protein
MRLAFTAFFATALFAVPSLSGAAERQRYSYSWPLAVSVPVTVSLNA